MIYLLFPLKTILPVISRVSPTALAGKNAMGHIIPPAKKVGDQATETVVSTVVQLQ